MRAAVAAAAAGSGRSAGLRGALLLAPPGSRRGFPTGPDMISLDTIRARQPRRLLRNDVFRAVPPKDLTAADLDEMATEQNMMDPAKVLAMYKKHASQDDPDPAVLIRAFTQLGFLFDPNSFFTSADRQRLRGHRDFRSLAHDLARVRERLPEAAAPVLLYAMACMEYRCAPLLPQLLEAAEQNVSHWRTDVLTLLLHSVASLGLGGASSGHQEAVAFDDASGSRSRDFSRLAARLAEELGRRADESTRDDGEEEGFASLHDWSRAAFAMVMANLYDVRVAPREEGDKGRLVLPMLVARACELVEDRTALDGAGWAQFFLYQTLYCVDVEKPACEEAVKRAVPMWIQERLHQRWLNDIVLLAQPQGADEMQRDVDAALRRTNTQALLNCSFGRDWDEQHCWFAGYLVNPKTSLECDSMLPLGPGRPRPSGWLALKSRMLRCIGYNVVMLHSSMWDKLDEDAKDKQIARIKAKVGYRHDHEQEKLHRKIREKPHTYTGLERKFSDWNPLPMAPDDSAAAAAAPAG